MVAYFHHIHKKQNSDIIWNMKNCKNLKVNMHRRIFGSVIKWSQNVKLHVT